MNISGKKIGVAFTGSYCTFDKVIPQIERLVKENVDVYPIFSEQSKSTDTRFGKASDFLKRVKEITGKDPIITITEAENLVLITSSILSLLPPVPVIPWPKWLMQLQTLLFLCLQRVYLETINL